MSWILEQRGLGAQLLCCGCQRVDCNGICMLRQVRYPGIVGDFTRDLQRLPAPRLDAAAEMDALLLNYGASR